MKYFFLAFSLLIVVLGIVSLTQKTDLPRIEIRAKYAQPRRLKVFLVPLQNPRKHVRQNVEKALREKYDVELRWFENVSLPESAYYKPRKRYRASKLIQWLKDEFSTGESVKILGVTEKDISITSRGVEDYGIMGLAYMDGVAAVVSSYRSKRNVGYIAVHEIAHTLGIDHCSSKGCVMHDGEGVEVDISKQHDFCRTCREPIQDLTH